MPIGVRGWTASGNSKTSGTTLALTSNGNADAPQVGDVVLVAGGFDNLSASTPSVGTCPVGSPAVTLSPVEATTANVSLATAAAAVRGGCQIGKVTSRALAGSEGASLVLDGSVAAKAGVALAFSGVDSYSLVLGTFGTPTYTTPSTWGADDVGIMVAAHESPTAPTAVSGTVLLSAATTGGSSTSNASVSVLMVTGPSQTLQASALTDGSYVVYRLIAAASGTTYTKTQDDTAGATDALTDDLAATRQPSDTAGATDSLGVVVSADRTISDSAGATDSLSAVLQGAQNYTPSPADTAGGTDALTAQQANARTLADSAGATDSLSAALSRDVTQNDPAGGSDSLSSAMNAARATDDTAGASDALTAVSSASRSIADTAGATDSLTAVVERITQISLSDVAGASDTLSDALDAVRAPSDSAGASDALTATQASARTLSDTANATDSLSAVKGAAPSLADTAGASDSLTVVQSSSRTISDQANATDSLTASKSGSGTANLSDSAAASDAATAAMDRPRAAADSAGATDALSRTLASSRALDDVATASDSLLVEIVRVFDVLLDDAASASDTLASIFTPQNSGEPVWFPRMVLGMVRGAQALDEPPRLALGPVRPGMDLSKE